MKVGKIGLSIVCVLAMQTAGFALITPEQVCVWIGNGGNENFSSSTNWNCGIQTAPPSQAVTDLFFPSNQTGGMEWSPTYDTPLGFACGNIVVNPGTTAYAINLAGNESIPMGTGANLNFQDGTPIEASGVSIGNLHLTGTTPFNITQTISNGVVPVITYEGSLFGFSGTTSINYLGPNNLFVSGDNFSYGGGSTNFTIYAGQVIVDAVEALGITSTNLILSGGGIQCSATTPTLAIPYTTTLTSLGGIVNSGGQVFTLGGSIIGAGVLEVTGGGTVNLTGTNNYSGGTNLVDATILGVGPGTTPLGSGPLAMAAGTTLQAAASVSLGNVIALAGAGTIDTQAFNLTLSGTITGAGPVTKAGSGLLTLTGANTYTGGTDLTVGTINVGGNNALGTGTLTMSAGTTLQAGGSVSLASPVSVAGASTVDTQAFDLTLSGAITGTSVLTKISSGTLTVTGVGSAPVTVNGGILTGDGTVGTLINNATVEPTSLETLSVAGNYTQSSAGTFAVDLNAQGQNSLLAITGTAQLDGTLDLNFLPGTYLNGTSYIILSAAGGILNNSTFPHVMDPPGPSSYQVIYLSNGVEILITGNSLFSAAGGVVVNHFNPRQVAAYLNGLTFTLGTDLANVVLALDGLSGSSAVSSALDQLHPAIFGAFELMNLNTITMVSSILTHRPARSCEPFNIWLEGFGYDINQDKIGEQVGFNAWDVGAVGGIDFSSNQFIFGIGGGYSYENVHWKKNRGHGSVDSAYIGLYTDWIGDSSYLEGAIVGGMNWYDATRRISFSSIQRTAKHDSSGYDLSAHVGGGFGYEVCSFTVGPFADVDYLFLSQNGFTEHGAQSLDLNVRRKQSQMLRSEAGLNFSQTYSMCDGGCIVPSVWVSCVNEAYLENKHYQSHLVGEPGEFRVRTWNKPITMVSPGGEVSFILDSGFALTATYSAEINSTTFAQKGRLRLEFNF